MNNKGFLFEIVISLLLIVSLSGIANAVQPSAGLKADVKYAQPLTQVKQTVPTITQPKQTLPTMKVLQTPLVVSEAVLSSTVLYNSIIAAIDRVHKVYSPLKFTDCKGSWYALDETYYTGYNTYVKSCANKSYSIQDQQNAGCLGSETLDKCTNKLFKYCLSRYEQDKKYWQSQPDGDLKTKITKGIEKSDKISSEARELSDALKALKNLMP